MTEALPQEIIRIKRDGGRLGSEQIDAFVRGLVDASWSESQAAALAMAIVLRGMDAAETAALTDAMTHSGEVLDWRGARLPGPVLDKHSTGGVGDKVSLLLGPMIAACGGVVPMLSGRGLGHTGGTLDKLEALPGYSVTPSHERLLQVLRSAGCAIVGASERIAPADRRLYAIRDATATVESVPLITASILSKKLAAGVSALVLDVKVGNGAFCTTLAQAGELARSLEQVARAAHLPCVALLTDMNQVLGTSAGNALEVREAIQFLIGDARDPRLLEVTLALCAQLLLLGGLAATLADARRAALHALDSGAAAQRFARMVAALGGPGDVLRDARLPGAEVQVDVAAAHAGFVTAIDTRALGLAVVTLGGGRRRVGDAVHPGVGLSQVVSLGARVDAGQPLACVHARDAASAQAAARAVRESTPARRWPVSTRATPKVRKPRRARCAKRSRSERRRRQRHGWCVRLTPTSRCRPGQRAHGWCVRVTPTSRCRPGQRAHGWCVRVTPKSRCRPGQQAPGWSAGPAAARDQARSSAWTLRQLAGV